MDNEVPMRLGREPEVLPGRDKDIDQLEGSKAFKEKKKRKNAPLTNLVSSYLTSQRYNTVKHDVPCQIRVCNPKDS